MRFAQVSHTRLSVAMPTPGARTTRSVRRPLVTALATVRPTALSAPATAPKKPESRVDSDQGPRAVAANGAVQSQSKRPSPPRAAALEGTNLYSMDDDDVHCTVEDLLTA